MSNVSQWKKKLRSLGRSLRPLEQEAENLTQELEDELSRLDNEILDTPGGGPLTPTQNRHLNDVDDLQGIAESAFSDIQRAREDIARFFRPAPRVRLKKDIRLG